MILQQDPIFPLIMTVFTFFIVVIQSIQNEKLLKNRFFLSFVNIAIAIVIISSYENYILTNTLYNELYSYYTLFVYLVYFLVFISSFRTSTLKANHYQLFVKSIKESDWNAYYVVDKKERIKDISQSILDEINYEKEDVIGKKLFNILNKTVRYTKLNDTDINNRTLENYYRDYAKTAKIGDSETQELVMLNYEGKEIIFKQMLQPVFVLGKYRGRIVVGEKKTDFDLLGVEKSLNKKTQALESIRQKFLATLEISNEGLFSIDLDERSLWASSSLVQMLNLPSSNNDLNDFRKLIHEDDLREYLAVLGELGLTRQQYLFKYRILKGNNYIWVEERGKRIFEDQNTATIMGTLNPVKNSHFRATNIDILDALKDYNNLLVDMNKLIQTDKYFYLMLLDLTNIPIINEKYSWEVGNMLMGEYINKMKSSFVTENGSIYRISGLKFVVLVTNPNKMNMIQKGSINNPNFFNLAIQYGSIKDELVVSAGISVSKQDAVLEEHLYQAAEQALKIAKNPSYAKNVVFYKEIND